MTGADITRDSLIIGQASGNGPESPFTEVLICTTRFKYCGVGDNSDSGRAVCSADHPVTRRIGDSVSKTQKPCVSDTHSSSGRQVAGSSRITML